MLSYLNQQQVLIYGSMFILTLSGWDELSLHGFLFLVVVAEREATWYCNSSSLHLNISPTSFVSHGVQTWHSYFLPSSQPLLNVKCICIQYLLPSHNLSLWVFEIKKIFQGTMFCSNQKPPIIQIVPAVLHKVHYCEQLLACKASLLFS